MTKDTPAVFDAIGDPIRRSVCVVTSVSPITITWRGQAGVLAEKVAGSTLIVGNAYVYYVKGGKPLVFQTATA